MARVKKYFKPSPHTEIENLLTPMLTSELLLSRKLSCAAGFSHYNCQFVISLRSGAILGEGECLINFRRSRKKREEKNAKK
jgi:hypothetical protein